MEKCPVVRHCRKIPENPSGPPEAAPRLPGLRGIGHARRVTTQPTMPTLDEIVASLRLLRERGLVRIRHSDLSALETAAGYTEVPAAAGRGPGAVEELLRAAVSRLGDGSLGAAATATFGLGRGARDAPAQVRRRRAALVYGVSVERFRKHHERVVIEQVAEEILKLCPLPPARGTGRGDPAAELRYQLAFTGTAGGERFPVTVHIEPVELLSDVDIVVVPQNVYLELPQHFKSSVAAGVSRAAALRGEDGQIVADVVRDEVLVWVRKHGRPGLPVAPGTVAPTSSGEMASQNVRRLYHAAIASPRPGTNDYEVEPTAIALAVQNVLATARAEREEFAPPLRSVGFPLLGAGRGGLPPAISFAWLWSALERDIREHGSWDIHFITRRRVTAELVVARLADAGIIPSPDGPAD